MNMYLPVGPRSGTQGDMPEGQWNAPSASVRVLLTALKLRGVGPAAVRKFASNLPPDSDLSPDLALYQDQRWAVGEMAYRSAVAATDAVVSACADKGISLVSMLDAAYPERLKRISDAPPILYVKGNVASLNGPSCAVVGTRHASEYGLTIAFRISALLSAQKFGVISGLALGIDTAAHEGALASEGVTVAVMAHGLDTVAPSSNRKLASKILDQGGALVSEHEPGVPARPAEFVRRNRIQSGIALCSIIVESGEVGGSMHQARFTRSQGKPVLAILPENGNGALRGFNHDGGRLLVSDYGAMGVRNTEDLMAQIATIAGGSSDHGGSTQDTLGP